MQLMAFINSLKKMQVYHIVRALRPRQWLKNMSIFAAPFFWGNLFDPDVFIPTFKAFLIFCAASAATYLVNDLIDAPKDRKHPIKKNRPIANRDVTEEQAVFVWAMLVMFTLIYSYMYFNKFFILTVLGYYALQVAYSLYFRNIIIMDALTVGTGFVLRVFAGTFASSVAISSWLILATIGLSLLMAFGKRRSERTILEAKNIPLETRETLKHYPDNLLDSMISISASFCVVSYALFAFQTSPTYTNKAIVQRLPTTLSSPKLMMLTIPIVIYGVARYLYVIYEKKEGESPERVLLSDRPLLNAVLIWSATILLIVYGL